MDINAASGRGTQHSEAKKQELMNNNQCFYCEIKGHRAKDFCKKAADYRPLNGRHTDNPGKGRPSTPIHNRASINTPKINMTTDDISGFLKDNMGLLDKDTKLSIVDSLMPKDFTQAQN